MSDRLVLPVNEEIERIESQMNSVIEDVRAGRETAEQKKKQLALTEKKIKALCNTIDKYIDAVSMSEKSQKRLD